MIEARQLARLRRRRRRTALAVAVLVGWCVVLAWHVRREYFRPFGVRLAEASANLTPSAAFYAIRLGDSPIGYAASRIDTLPDGFIVSDEMRLRVRALGSDVPASARTVAHLGKRLELQSFEFDLSSDFGDFRVDGTVRADSVLDLEVQTGADRQRLAVPTGGPILLPVVMPVHFALGAAPKSGGTYSFEIFDPSTLDRQTVTLEVIGRETRIHPDSAVLDSASGEWVPATFDTVLTWHVVQRLGGIEIESWLDPEGQVVRAESPLGYTIERTAFEIAWYDYQALRAGSTASGAAPPDIIERTAIGVGVELPGRQRLERLAVRLMNVDLAGFDLQGERQELRADTLFVELEPAGIGAGYSLPASRSEWPQELGATPLIQTEDPMIGRRAREAVGVTTDPVEAARRLNDWVYRTLEKKVTLSVPSARQVLESGQGDCNEHTVLYVAAARAIGLPARTAAGLVYVRGRFYYHAWPEVWLGRWVPVDPTLGQFPADASHLRFVIGGLARQVELVRLIGSLSLDVVAVEER